MVRSLFDPIVDIGGKLTTRSSLREEKRQELAIKKERAQIATDKQRRIDDAQARAAEAVAEKAALELADVQAVHNEKQAVVAKAENVKIERERAAQRIKRSRRNNVIAVAAACAVIEFAGQVIFFFGYLDTWPPQLEFLLLLAPFIVPAITWGFSRDAYLRAKDKEPYGKSMMVMWISAVAAAAMITYELTLLLKIPGLPEFFGAPSIVGPAIFHWHVGSVSQDAHEVSGIDRAKQIARKWANRARHPFIWWAAIDICHSSQGVVDFEHAFLMAYRAKKGHFPGLLPVYIPDVRVRRLKRLRRLLDRRVFGASNVVSNVSPSNVVSNVAPGRHSVEVPATSVDVAQDSNVPVTAVDEQRSNVAPPESEAEVTMPMGTLLSEVESYLSGKGLDVAPRDVAGAYQDADTLLATRMRSSGDVAQYGATFATSPSNVVTPDGQSNVSPSNVARRQPRESNVARRDQKSNVALFRRGGATSGYGVAATLVREYVDQLLASNVPIDEIYGGAAAETVNPKLIAQGLKPIKRQAAARTIKEYREKLAAHAAERREA